MIDLNSQTTTCLDFVLIALLLACLHHSNNSNQQAIFNFEDQQFLIQNIPNLRLINLTTLSYL